MFDDINMLYIILYTSRYWKTQIMHDTIIKFSVIHNIIIKNECDINTPIRDANLSLQKKFEIKVSDFNNLIL